MYVGLLTVILQLPAIGSLKDKRKIVKSVLERLRSRFNCSAAELDGQDSRLVARLGVAVVSGDDVFVQQQLDTILTFVRQDGRFFLGRVERQVFSAGDELPLM